MITRRFKFFRIRLDQLPLSDLPPSVSPGCITFLWTANSSMTSSTASPAEVLKILSRLEKAFRDNLPTEKMSNSRRFVEQYHATFAQVRQVSYTHALGQVCPNCMSQSRTLGTNRATASIVGRSKRTNVVEYPPWALRKTKKKDNYMTMADLVEPLHTMELSSEDQNVVRCPHPQCDGHRLRRVEVIRDRMPLVYTLGTTVINALQYAPNARFTSNIEVKYLHEQALGGYRTAEYMWLGAVYVLKDRFSFYTRALLDGHVYCWSGDKQGAWVLLSTDDMPATKHLVLLFYWLESASV